MPGRYERVCVGWHCAKVKGHAELKIEKSRVKTFIYDFSKLHHSSPNSFGANVHLRHADANVHLHGQKHRVKQNVSPS